MDKIQIAAALTSQAEQLGKATNASQVLQIANDTARLNVKQSILALEDAIAAKDEAAIIAATNKLNTDLKVLGTLGAQNLKLLDIKSLLESLKPKDLINITNLEAALALLKQINLTSTGSTKAITPAAPTATGIPLLTDAQVNEALAAGSFVPVVAATGGVVGGSTTAGAYASSGFPGAATNDPTTVNITVNTGIGDPNAIAEAIDQVLTDARQRGTLGTFAA
jgi:glycosyltransferase involved in cell wall biosynthesis